MKRTKASYIDGSDVNSLPPKPRFVVENGQELFFIRTGNATNQLKPSELVAYCAGRWPEAIAAG